MLKKVLVFGSGDIGLRLAVSMAFYIQLAFTNYERLVLFLEGFVHCSFIIVKGLIFFLILFSFLIKLYVFYKIANLLIVLLNSFSSIF